MEEGIETLFKEVHPEKAFPSIILINFGIFAIFKVGLNHKRINDFKNELLEFFFLIDIFFDGNFFICHF